MKKVAIIGAGVLGRTLALTLVKKGQEVELWDPEPESGGASSAYLAGGMLAPYSEKESADPIVFEMGMASLELWEQVNKDLKDQCGFSQKGSLIISHSRDLAKWEEVKSKISCKADVNDTVTGPPKTWEPALENRFSKGLFLPREAQVDPRQYLESCYRYLLSSGAKWNSKRVECDAIQKTGDFDWIVDCRGMGATDKLRDLRGVRGEAILIHAPKVTIRRPIRVMHPRYSLYIVPRQNGVFYLGATQIESDQEDPISVRSCLELLSAAFAVHPGFGEGSILETYAGLRPAFFHNNPEVRVRDTYLSINGLYRHGFLLSPIISEITCAYMLEQQTKPFGFDIIRENP